MEDILDFDTSGYIRINRGGDILHMNFNYFTQSWLSGGWVRPVKAGQLGWVGMDGSGRVGDLEPCRSIHIYRRLWVGCTK